MKMYGRYETSQLPLLLADVDVSVVASRVWESFSLTTRELLALGIPVFAAAMGALPEVVVPGVNGELFDPARPSELASLLRKAAGDGAYRHRLSAGAAVTSITSVFEHARALHDVYESTISGYEPAHDNILHEFDALMVGLHTLGFAA
jgi:D-inositol-3-phosphate glycosyltransferase